MEEQGKADRFALILGDHYLGMLLFAEQGLF